MQGDAMTAASNKSYALFIICILISILVSFPPASSQTAGGSTCAFGTYRHEERNCCLCGVGLKLKTHCVNDLQYGSCEPCEPGTYSSHPSKDTSCETCTYCDHRNENLEEDEPCTAPRNAKCRCRPDHYCISNTEICLLCHPCKKCGAEGIKVKCAGKNNTVCNEEIKGGNQAGIIAGIVVSLLALLIIAAVFLWIRKRSQSISKGSGQQNITTGGIHGNADVLEMQPLNVPDVDLQPLIPDIVKIMGWKDMQEVATRSGVRSTDIESCKLDHPGDSDEQTRKLLSIWVEKEGKAAPRRLIEILQCSKKKAKEEKVMALLLNARENTSA